MTAIVPDTITAPSDRLWANAQRDAAIIMGRKPRQRGRPTTGYERGWNSDDDPLAWWCLTELLVSYGMGRKS